MSACCHTRQHPAPGLVRVHSDGGGGGSGWGRLEPPPKGRRHMVVDVMMAKPDSDLVRLALRLGTLLLEPNNKQVQAEFISYFYAIDDSNQKRHKSVHVARSDDSNAQAEMHEESAKKYMKKLLMDF